MSRSRVFLCALLAIIAVTAAAFAVSYRSTKIVNAASTRQIQVRWLISHQPVDVFTRATQVFAQELSKDSNGQMTLVVVTPAQLGLSTAGDVPEPTITALLDNGTIDLASPYTVPLGQSDPDFSALNLPFLFGSYAEATSTLDGPIGMQILQGLASKMDAHGLAFTMSGGFRIIASKDTKITSPADLKGKRIATSGGPVAEATLKALGAVPVAFDLESGAPADLTDIDGIETTYARLSGILGADTQYTKYIDETDHSLFLTAIVESDSFYDSLPPADQAALQKAALAAAQVEREDSIALNATTKAALTQRGSVITTLTPQERDVFKAQTRSVYAQFQGTFQQGLVSTLLAGN
jgi:TRAP-type C4-dicarboxylate transport system substrate-binding protein